MPRARKPALHDLHDYTPCFFSGRYRAEISAISATEAAASMLQPEQPAKVQRAASEGGGGTGRTAVDGSSAAAMVDSAPTRRSSGAGGATAAVAAKRARLAHWAVLCDRQGSGRPRASKRQQPRRLAAGRHSGGSGGGGETSPQSQAAHEPWGLRQEAQDGVSGAARRWSGRGGRMGGRVGQGYACEPCRAGRNRSERALLHARGWSDPAACLLFIEVSMATVRQVVSL